MWTDPLPGCHRAVNGTCRRPIPGHDGVVSRRPSPPFAIRPETPGDSGAVRRLVARAFGSDAEALLVDRIRDSPGYVPEMALVAVAGGDVAGHVMISGALLRGAAGDRPIVMLSPLAVDPALQRRGIGSALVRSSGCRPTIPTIRPCGARWSIRRRSTGWEAPDPGRSLGDGGPSADAPLKGRHRCLPPGCIPACRPTTP